MTYRAKACPRESTADMREAGWQGFMSVEDTGDARSMLGAIWRAMYDAAPAAPSDDALVAALRERDAATARADALHKALRKRVIHASEYKAADGDYEAAFYECAQCSVRWNVEEDERHAPGCLAGWEAIDAALAEQEGK